MVREMEEHLHAIRVAAKGNARRELEALFLLALEREELAAIGYGGEGVHARVAALQADDATRGVVAYALRWASRDERTHAVLARGLLVQTGRTRLAAARLAAGFGGWIAGWAAAIVTHTTFRRAPLSQLAARAIVALGRVAGKVPETAAAALRHQSFARFCAFQVGAEKTAVLSWDHVARILADDPKYAKLAPTATRIANDERKHERVLGVLLAAFDDEDRPREGYDAERLADALRDVDPAFVRGGARRDRVGALGEGGVVAVREDARTRAADPDALRELLRGALAAVDLDGAIGASAGRVAIKTSFMLAYDRRDPSAHVDRVLAEELARILIERGATDVAYLEAPNHWDLFFAGRSVAEVARYLGFESPLYRIVDVSEDQVPHAFRRGLGQDSVSRTWRDADTRVVFAKMRTHPMMLVHLATSALESLGKRIEELLFEEREADLASGSMMFVDAFPPDLAILDATHHVPDGLTGILGDPTPTYPGRIYAARDPIALDIVAARHMGVERFPSENAIALALDWFDDPRPRTTVDGPDTRIAGLSSPHRNDLTVLLSTLAYPVYVFLGDRGNLWVPRMDPSAFPMRRRQTLAEWLIRPLLRSVFGFGKPPRLARSARAAESEDHADRDREDR
ncbi:MAG: DUF362 domain-containing protein [Polyangiaceae bacterium]